MSNKNNVIQLFSDAKTRNMTNTAPSREDRVAAIQQAALSYLKTSYAVILVA